jgi:radical SAM-linked protein
MQRLRIRFGRGEEVKFISHLDIVRFWERALRRAAVPLAYSEGFAPHPRMSLAAPLAVGVTSGAELMDVWLKYWMPSQAFMMKVKSQLPRGLEIFNVWQVVLSMPSVQSCVAFAEYHVEVEGNRTEQELNDCLRSLLQASKLPWHHSRGDKEHFYDLRPLIDDLWLIEGRQVTTQSMVEGWEYISQARGPGLLTSYVLGMRLRCDAGGSGRPEQVTAALGFSKYPESIHRTKLILKTDCHCEQAK